MLNQSAVNKRQLVAITLKPLKIKAHLTVNEADLLLALRI